MNDRSVGFGFRPAGVLKRKIFIGGINPALGNDVLETYFGKFGTLEDATIMRYADGRSRGFGFVVFRDESSCQRALQQRNHPITPHDKVEVKPCLSRSRTRVPVPAGPPGSMVPGGPGYGGYRSYDAGYYNAVPNPYRSSGYPELNGAGGSGTVPYGAAYDSHDYANTYTDARGARPGDPGIVGLCNGYTGGYNVSVPSSDYTGYTAGGVASTVPTQSLSGAPPHASRNWNGATYQADENSNPVDYWRDPYDASYASAEYYSGDTTGYMAAAAAAGHRPPGSLAVAPNTAAAGTLMQRNVSHPYSNTLPQSSAIATVSNVQSAPPHLCRDGYYDAATFGANDGRTGFSYTNQAAGAVPGNAAARRASGVSAPTTEGNANVSTPLAGNTFQSDGGISGYTPMRRSSKTTSTAYSLPSQQPGSGYGNLSGYGRAAPY